MAGLHRAAAGLDPIVAPPNGGTAAAYLHLLEGEPPRPERARALERYLVLTIDHGLNASTFTVRTVTSTGTDLGASRDACVPVAGTATVVGEGQDS